MASASHISAAFRRPADQAGPEGEPQACDNYLRGTFSWEFTRGMSVVLEGNEEHAGAESLSVSLEGTLAQTSTINPKWRGLINILHTWTL